MIRFNECLNKLDIQTYMHSDFFFTILHCDTIAQRHGSPPLLFLPPPLSFVSPSFFLARFARDNCVMKTHKRLRNRSSDDVRERESGTRERHATSSLYQCRTPFPCGASSCKGHAFEGQGAVAWRRVMAGRKRRSWDQWLSLGRLRSWRWWYE